MHIENLYKDQRIFLFKRCFALEKIHGTSSHLTWKDGKIIYAAGGENHGNFIKLFDEEVLTKAFTDLGYPEVTIYGEAYGGKQQGQSWRYGKVLKFCAFDVEIGESWLNVPNAHQVAQRFGIEFVHYVEIDATVEQLDFWRDAPSEQAKRNGVEGDQPREGIVCRPLQEFRDSAGARIMCKHKRAEERETKTIRNVDDPAKLQVLTEAQAIADEWVTPTRLEHVLDKLPGVGMQDIPKIIEAMQEDVFREGAGEVVDSKEARRAIGTAAVKLFKKKLDDAMRKGQA